MITDLLDLPELTASWLESLRRQDAVLYADLARDLVIERATVVIAPSSFGSNHRHVTTVFATLDMVGKRIGAYETPPDTSRSPFEGLRAYDSARKREFMTDADLMFVGNVGNALIVSMDSQTGIMDLSQEPISVEYLAPNFDRFVVTQANAYDSFKRHIVDTDTEDAYWTDCKSCLEHPAFKGTDVERIFFMQLKS